MEHAFWDERWADGRIGFHLNEVNPTLSRHFDTFVAWLGTAAARDLSVLVPLCGKSLDLYWLAQRCRRVVGVEFVRTAAEQYFEERGVKPDAQNDTLRHDNTALVVGDFFQVTSATAGEVDIAYDRAALVAIAPERRVEYLAQLHRLLSPGGGVLLISFEHDIGSGPPFSIDAMESLFEQARAVGASFSAERHTERDILDHEPRFRERASYLREVVWFVRRT